MASHDGTVVKLDELHRGSRLYLPDGLDRTVPAVSPVLTRDLSGLSPALVVTCECDPLRDEGEAYVTGCERPTCRLRTCANPAMIHGFLQLAGRLGRAGLCSISWARRRVF